MFHQVVETTVELGLDQREGPAVRSELMLRERVVERLREALGRVPGLRIGEVEQEETVSGRASDALLRIQTPARRRRLVVEVKRDLQPRGIGVAAAELKRRLGPGAVGVLAAPYLSERSRDLCQQLGVSCLDLAGNARIAFDQVFIDQTGRPNPEPRRRLQRSLFSPRSTRVLRVLLENPARRWYVRDLAAEARVSLAQTSNLKRLLTEQDFLGLESRQFWLAQPGQLLRDWAEAYDPEANTVQLFYSMLPLPEIERRLGQECERLGVRCGLALFSGAERVAPFARYNRAAAFIGGRTGEVATALALRPVDTGANVALLTPYDDGVFYGMRSIGGLQVVSDVQLYLDLKSSKGRGDEAAEFLLERSLRPRWL